MSVMASLMLVSRWVTMPLPPGVHLLAPIMAAATLVYRSKALVSIYLFVILYGLLIVGFTTWWIPYLFVFLPLWAMFMIAGKFKLKVEVKIPLYMALCAIHGLAFGALFAPFHAVFFGLNIESTLAWIAAGLHFDTIHAFGNFFSALLIVPLVELLRMIQKDSHI